MAKNKDNRASNRVHMAAEEEFIRYHKALRGQIDNANWHFQTWKRLWKS